MKTIARSFRETQWYEAVARQFHTESQLMWAAYIDWMERNRY